MAVSRGVRSAVLAVVAVGALAVFAYPWIEALAFVARAAALPGAASTLASVTAESIASRESFDVPTRQGAVAARLYRPAGSARRAVLLVPGVHMDGIDESRLVSMAEDLAETGYAVLTVAPPDLRAFQITPASTDVIEDAAIWLSDHPELAPDGRIGMIGISFSGGLSLVAAGRDALAGKVAFVMSFGGHGDLPRVLRYLCSGVAQAQPDKAAVGLVEGGEHLAAHPPHDYGVAVVLLGLADHVVPPAQVEPLRRGIRLFLAASSLTIVDMTRAEDAFARARAYAASLPEPARGLMDAVNARAVDRLGPILLPVLDDAAGIRDPALSPERSPLTAAPVFLLHGADDTVIPAVETVMLTAKLHEAGTEVHALLSGLITHAEVDRAAAAADVFRLVAFWRGLMAH